MANVFTNNMRLFVLDTAPVIIPYPLNIRKIFLYPALAANAAVLSSYNLRSTPISTHTSVLTTTLGTTITTVDAVLANADADALDVINIKNSSSGKNIGQYVIATHTPDTVVVLGGTPWSTTPLTNEAAVSYSWDIIRPYTSIPILSPAADVNQVEIDFGDNGMIFPNLLLTSLSANAKLYIYYK